MSNEVNYRKKMMIENEGRKILDSFYDRDFKNYTDRANFATMQLQMASEDVKNDYEFMLKFLNESRRKKRRYI
jgi:hypothetical protein